MAQEDTVHRVTADCGSTTRGCWVALGSDGWRGQTVSIPAAWFGKRIPGTVTIHSNWGTGAEGSATFVPDDGSEPIAVYGGKPDLQHFFPA